MAASPGSRPISPTSSSAPSTDPTAEPPRRQRVLYGRRSGPGLRPGQRERLDRLLPRLAIDLPAAGALDPASLFTPPRQRLWLEIGFGGGEHLAAQAAANPTVGLIGVEPFVDGVARLLAQVEERQLHNVRLLVDDARLLLDRLPEASIERLFVLFADPWPKKRHWKRRIVNAETVARFADLLVDDGELRVATDDPGYRRWMLACLLGEQRLDWCVRGPEDWRDRPPDWPPTRYEKKALAAGRRPVFLRFRRKSRTAELATSAE